MSCFFRPEDMMGVRLVTGMEISPDGQRDLFMNRQKAERL